MNDGDEDKIGKKLQDSGEHAYRTCTWDAHLKLGQRSVLFLGKQPVLVKELADGGRFDQASKPRYIPRHQIAFAEWRVHSHFRSVMRPGCRREG